MSVYSDRMRSREVSAQSRLATATSRRADAEERTAAALERIAAVVEQVGAGWFNVQGLPPSEADEGARG